MAKTYVLVDLQNKRPNPSHVAAWIGAEGEAWIFYGEQEIGLLAPYFVIGPQVSIVPISRPGSNSLDFHLIMYLGYLIARRKKDSKFVVVAKDRDYDPAIDHARAQGIEVVRLSELPAGPQTIVESNAKPIARPNSAKKSSAIAPLASAVDPTGTGKPRRPRSSIAVYAGILRDIKLNRPGDLQALRSRIRSRLGQDSSDAVAQILEHLVTMDIIRLDSETLTYLK